MKIQYVHELIGIIPEEEWLILEVLRGIVIERLAGYGKEKIAYNVPYFYGNKGICIIWPAGIPRGGIKEGVLFGFWRGNELDDVDNYLTHGTNKKIYYKIYKNVEEIKVQAIEKLLDEAIALDKGRG